MICLYEKPVVPVTDHKFETPYPPSGGGPPTCAADDGEDLVKFKSKDNKEVGICALIHKDRTCPAAEHT